MLGVKDQVKFVIEDLNDFNYAVNVCRSNAVMTNKIFQPAWGKIDNKELVQWILDEKITCRLILQQHKIIYGARRRGV